MTTKTESNINRLLPERKAVMMNDSCRCTIRFSGTAKPAPCLRIVSILGRAVRTLFLFVFITVFVPCADAQLYDWQMVTDDADFGPRDGAGPFVFDSLMWLAGGWNPDSVPTTMNEVWSSEDGISWDCVTADAQWDERHCMGTVVYDDKMWVIGGDGHTDVWNSEDGVTWTMVTDSAPWGQRYKPYVLVFKDTIWLMGGFNYYNGNAIAYNDVWHTTDGANWSLATSNGGWSPRGIIHGKVVFDDKMWILGGGLYVMTGYPTETYYKDVWSSPDGIHWTQVLANAPWVGRIHHSTEVYDGRMWLMAGHNKTVPAGPFTLRNDVWFSYDGVNWAELMNVPWAHTHAASIYVYDSALWLAGGYLRNEVWQLHKSIITDNYALVQEKFVVYPNPAKEKINVKCKNGYREKALFNIGIMDRLGKTVFAQEFHGANYQVLEYDVSFLPQGLYFVNIWNEKYKQSLKLVIAR